MIRKDLAYILDSISSSWNDVIMQQYKRLPLLSVIPALAFCLPIYSFFDPASDHYYDLNNNLTNLFGRYPFANTLRLIRKDNDLDLIAKCCKEINNTLCLTAMKKTSILELRKELMDFGGAELGTFLNTYATRYPSAFNWRHTDTVCPSHEDIEGFCYTDKIWKKLEFKLHSFFMQLTEAFDLRGAKYITSLLELPTMISAFSYQDAFTLSHSQIPYTQCTFTASLLQDCNSEWSDYIESAIAGQITLGQVPNCSFLVEDFVGRNLQSIFRMMKLVRHQGKSFITEPPHNRQFLPQYEKHNLSDKAHQVDLLSAIPHCEFGRKWTHNSRVFNLNCTLFSPVATDKGICYSFNALNFTDLHHDSYFADTFKTTHNDDFSPSREVRHFLESEEKAGLLFYLDRQAFLRGDRDKTKLPQHSFSVSLNNALNPFQVRSKKTNVRIGYWTSLYVTLSQLITDPEVRNVPINRRKCKFTDEVDSLRLFKFYTQSSCQFECLLDQSQKACNCTPWNYPFPGSQDDMKMCEMLGAACFEEFMGQHAKECDCPPDCEAIEFRITAKEETPLDPDEFCGPNYFNIKYLTPKMLTRSDKVNHIMTSLNLSRVATNGRLDFAKPDQVDSICRDLVNQDLAVVTIQMNEDTFIRSKRSLKMTFEAQLGTIGGTLGLFTGMSLLSLA